jgi:hypothetical protein
MLDRAKAPALDPDGLPSFPEDTMRRILPRSLILSLLMMGANPLAAQQVPGPPPTPTPFVNLKAAYPYGEPLGGIGIPGNTRAVVAGGATLSIIDLTTIDPETSAPAELQRSRSRTSRRSR